jgi:Protein of unknown function (DUF4019)
VQANLNDFLKFIPAAATSPYAYGVYAICAALFVLVGSRLRTVQTVLKRIARVPTEDRRHVIESVTNSVIPDTITADPWIRNNRNRALFQLAAVVAILAAALATIDILRVGIDLKPPPTESQAAEESKAFLSKLDAGNYSGAYYQMSNDFRQTFPLQRWLSASETFRAPLGAQTNRIDASSGAGEQAFGGRELNLHWYTYYTKFANRDQAIAEFVSLASPGAPQPWRVVAYQIGVDPNAAKIRK